MAAKWWEPPRDALDTMVLGAADLDALKGLRHVDFTPFDPTLKARSALGHLLGQSTLHPAPLTMLAACAGW